MRKHLLLYTFLFLSLHLFAQQGGEVLVPLKYNSQLISEKNNKMQSDIFVYEIDTIRIPFKDDFSSDKFKKFDAQPGDANVNTQTEYYLYNDLNTIKLPDTVSFSATPTYRITYDTVGVDTTIYTKLDSVLITIYDLSSYPFSFNQQYVWPPYYIYDTLFAPPADTAFLTPDFIQDSVYIHFVAATDNGIWQDNFVYRNSTFPINPPTVGVVTFDGLDENGYPYDFSDPNAEGIGDYLTSKPINLGFDIFSNPYVAADSIYLSFYYQSTGRGEEPEPFDSLFLEFWSPSGSEWTRVWVTPGFTSDSIFHQKNILINPLYLQNGFKFRFGNYGSLAGSIDHWHVDYVYLDETRALSDTIRDDVAFQYSPNSLLSQYSAVPWSHYKWNPSLYMADTLSTFQRNNANVGHLVGNNFMDISYQGAITNSFAHPNNPSIAAFTNYQTLWDVGLQPFVFDTLVNDTCATFQVSFRHQATPDFERENDTVQFNQVFENYYAYDDGTAEWGYGLNVAGAQLAYKFDLMQPDSIRALDIYFHPDINDVSNAAFTLMIWDDDGSSGKPGTVIYQNSNFHEVQYTTERYGFREYFFEDKVYLPAGSYYVGVQQLDADRLNIGLDFNTNRKNKIYFNTGGSWTNTSNKAALMIRPIFANLCDQMYVGTEEIEIDNSIFVYPNPANNYLNFESDKNDFEITLTDISGRIVLQQKQTSKTIQLNDVSEGVYILQIHTPENGQTFVEKIMIRK